MLYFPDHASAVVFEARATPATSGILPILAWLERRDLVDGWNSGVRGRVDEVIHAL
jgi:hypothetical protein